MSSLNKVLILGRLGQDPEIRYTQNQTAVVTLNVATSENWTKDGQKQEQTEWHRVIVWSKQAENCAKYLAKGRGVFVEGRLQTRQWEDKTGQKRFTTEIIATNVQFLPGGSGGGMQPGAGSSLGSSSMGSAMGEQGGFSSSYESAFPQADSFASSNQRFPAASAPMSAPSHGAMDLDDIPF